MSKPDNIAVIPASLEGSFFKYWLEFLRPLHKLTDREIEVTASFIKYRHQLNKVVNDLDLLDKITLDSETRRKVIEECHLTQAHFQVIMTKLRKRGVIMDNKINPKYIPRFSNDKTFNLLISFNVDDQ